MYRFERNSIYILLYYYYDDLLQRKPITNEMTIFGCSVFLYRLELINTSYKINKIDLRLIARTHFIYSVVQLFSRIIIRIKNCIVL